MPFTPKPLEVPEMVESIHDVKPTEVKRSVKPTPHTTPRIMACCKHCHRTTGRRTKKQNVIVIVCANCWESGFR